MNTHDTSDDSDPGGERALRLRLALWPEVLDRAYLAQAFGVSKAAIRRAERRGEIGASVRIGRRTYFRRDSVLAALAARERVGERS